MTAVADPPVDTLAAPRQEVMFTARRDGLKLVYRAEYPIFGPQGHKTGMITEGVRIPFAGEGDTPGGVLRVPLEGTVTTEQGRQFPADELLTWLRRHPLHGNRDDGFWEIAQVAPPVSDAEAEAVSDAAVRHDTATLTAMLDRERAGWDRPGLVRNIEKQLATIEQMAADYAKQIEAQQAEADKPAAKAAPKKAAT